MFYSIAIDDERGGNRMSLKCEDLAYVGKEGLHPDERLFLEMANDSVSRKRLLARLERLGLLSAFLEAENGTSQ